MNDELTVDHDIYISVGLHNPMKPSVFKEIIDTMLFENIGYMSSWGTHTKDEYIEVMNEQIAKVEEMKLAISRALLSLSWSNTDQQIPAAIHYLESALRNAPETTELHSDGGTEAV